VKAQRTIAVTMIVGASVLTAWASRDITFPAILCTLGLLGLRGRFTWDIRPEQRFVTPLLLLVLAILFALHCRYTHVHSEEAAAFAWETIARYFLASMILILFLRSPDRLPPSLGLFQLAAVMAAGQVLLLDDQYLAFRLSELLSVTLVVLYAAAGRVAASGVAGNNRTHQTYGTHEGLTLRTTHFALLLLAINVGWVAGSLLYRRVETLNLLPAWFWRGGIVLEGATDNASQVGFSTSGRLSGVLAIKEGQDAAPVLKITCVGSPGYLRARAFDEYRRSEWHDLSTPDAIYPEQNVPFGLYFVGRTSLFRLNDRNAPKSMIVRHEVAIADAIFTPLGVSSVEAPFDVLLHDQDDILRPRQTRGSLGYRISYTTAGNLRAPSGMQARWMLDFPPELDPRIHQLAGKLFAGCSTTAEKIGAVVDYFRTRYTYSLAMDIPPDEDKLVHFLLEESSGYCEYFASGAAILLRIAGVPTRYITGFLVTERGDQANSWIARNMDAHAWVEAWDQEKNEWSIVEATVQENLGEEILDDESAHGGGSGALFLARFLQALYDYGLFGMLAWLFESYGLRTGLSLCIACLGAAAGLALLRRSRKSQRGTASRGARSPECAALHKMLAVVDRKAKALGLRRESTETLRAFAERLRAVCGTGPSRAGEPRDSALPTDSQRPVERMGRSQGEHPGGRLADWYLEYAGLRYGRTIDPGRLEQLQRFTRRRQWPSTP